MVNAKYALKEIKKHPVKHLAVYVQLIVSVILFSFLVFSFCKVDKFTKRLNEAVGHENMYIAGIYSNPVQLMSRLNEEDASASCRELYNYIKSNTVTYINFETAVCVNGKDIKLLQVNQPTCGLYSIDVSSGRMFSDEELSEEEQVQGKIPVIAGFNMQKDYPVGTEFTETTSGNSFSFEVVGILKKNLFTLNPATSREVNYLDDSLLIPWIPHDELNNGYRNANLFGHMLVETEDPGVLEKIKAKSEELSLFDLEFATVRENIEYVNSFYNNAYLRDIVLLCILLIYCTIGSITLLLQYIRVHVRQFAVFMMCGADKSDILCQMLILAALPIVFGIVVSNIIFLNSTVLFTGILFGLALLALIMVIPAITWNRMEISSIFKKYE